MDLETENDCQMNRRHINYCSTERYGNHLFGMLIFLKCKFNKLTADVFKPYAYCSSVFWKWNCKWFVEEKFTNFLKCHHRMVMSSIEVTCEWTFLMQLGNSSGRTSLFACCCWLVCFCLFLLHVMIAKFIESTHGTPNKTNSCLRYNSIGNSVTWVTEYWQWWCYSSCANACRSACR